MRIAGNYLLYVLQCWSSCLLHTVTIKMCFIFLKTNRLFQIPKTLTFKTRCKTKYSCKHEFIHMRIKKIYHFHVSGLGQPRVETEVLGNWEMAY